MLRGITAVGRLTLLEAGGMDVFKGAAFTPRRSEEEGAVLFSFLPLL